MRRDANSWNNKLELVILDHGLYHEIDDEFRVNYCHLWKSIINRDENGMKAVARKLGVNAYELFAVMLTSRSWDLEDVGFSSSHKLTSEQLTRMQQFGMDNFFNMTQVLSGVNRKMLLLLKAK